MECLAKFVADLFDNILDAPWSPAPRPGATTAALLLVTCFDDLSGVRCEYL